ncbi:MAG: sigma-70 family RNA polymerase sigma factor [Bacteroidota bacterium]|nr:sigma-70 family RNA polymerase sigma factor [Bacteroidota bacterium]MDP4212614.1 sigma-70 family RNA polymerase sigma factor [Bacteroidota bacterium]MDP4248680.1 sigma-70 family RNA polymerase sigma factor [Bacteroidota bacterium]
MSSVDRYDDEMSLVLAFRRGENAALRQVYDVHYHSLWNYSRNLIEDDLQAEDIVTDAFLKTWARRKQFEDIKGLINYLFIATRNASLNYIQQNKRKKSAHREIAYLSDKITSKMEAELIRAELIQLAFLKAEEFPAQMKKVFMMIFREGLKLPEVAEQLGLSINTVKTHKAAALKSLRQIMVRQLFTIFNFFFF